MKYSAKLERDLLRKTEELNDEIDRRIDLDKPEDMETVENLMEEVQNIKEERDLAAARQYFAKAQLEGEKPTRFFCSLNKKRMEKVQFEDQHVVEKKNNGE